MANEAKTPLLIIDGKEITLSSGGHNSRESGVCAMEAVAWMAGEPHSDRPQCVSPMIAEFLRSWNDSLSDESRTELIAPLLSMTIGTRTTPEAEETRGWKVLDWMIRVSLPTWLDLTESLRPHAELLRSLAEVTALTIDVILPALYAARSAADSAARSAADSAARSAAYSAADSVLSPVVNVLQLSACGLIKLLCTIK